ncbi:bacillithiol biosynthesis cysteine-adding enzyme BshC [Candidatus Frackibacter sp. WG12]|nr:bacillithiol biosynthesis cysteine-adding enzyme BshC [Candidatus Frackibacter sp. WG12]SFL93858.1 bacillithiol biosynthesis cysteine-adding enzyme BshC [Candidatus Frackibacter sp. WG13]
MMTEESVIGNQLYHDYLFNFEAVADFYEYDSRQEVAFTERVSYLNNNYQQDRDHLAAILKDYNQKLGCSQEVITNIEALKRNETGAVVTGQQAGIFTGPLYTVYKAINAILLAERTGKLTDSKVVPIFWVASEDHDFQEINHINLVNANNQLETVELVGDYIATSIGNIEVNEDLFKLIDRLAEETYDTEFKERIISNLRNLAQEADDLAEWFSRIMLDLFNDYGLIIFDPMWPEIRQLSSGIYQEIICKQSEIKEKFQQTNYQLNEAGYPLQVDKSMDNSHLFIYFDQERNSLLSKTKAGGKHYFETRNQKVQVNQEDILQMIEQEPVRFSPNVVLRPIVQEYLLPTVAYVGGPGEIAYHSQLKGLYSIFDLQMPILYPRESITVVEARLASYMDKYGLTRKDIINFNLDKRLEEELADKDELDIPQIFNDVKDKFACDYQELIKQISEIDQNLQQLGEQNLERIIGQVDYLEEKTQQFHKRNSEVLVRQFKKLKNNLLPNQNLQERYLNIFPYLIKYSHTFIDDLVDYFELEFTHRLYYYRGDK